MYSHEPMLLYKFYYNSVVIFHEKQTHEIPGLTDADNAGCRSVSSLDPDVATMP